MPLVFISYQTFLNNWLINNRTSRVVCRSITLLLTGEFMKYFKKANGMVYKVMPNHDIESLKARFEECDAKGNAIKKEKPKAKPKVKKKAGK